jgi:hypothetical protein
MRLDEALAIQLSYECPFCAHLSVKAREFCNVCSGHIEKETEPKRCSENEFEGERAQASSNTLTPSSSREASVDGEEKEFRDSGYEGGKTEKDKGKEKEAQIEHKTSGSTYSERQYQRIWSFEFVPLGFFGRLIVRVLSIGSIQVSFCCKLRHIDSCFG